MNFYLLILILHAVCLVASGNISSSSSSHITSSSSSSNSNVINWKYISLNAPNSLLKQNLDSIFSFENYHVDFKPSVSQVHDRLTKSVLGSLYGVDLSNNEITDRGLALIFTNNMDLFRGIRFLDLSGNRLSRWNGTRFVRELLVNLEVLILDNNEHLASFNFNLVNLKVLSLTSCNLAFATDFERISLTSLVYLGLGDNKITDMSIDLSVYNIIDFLVPKRVHMLDLSHNKLTKIETLTYLFKSANVTELSVERNLLSHFDINELLAASPELATDVRLNLKYNFIRNTSEEFFRIASGDYDYNNHFISARNHSWDRTRFSLELLGNPLVCDCESMWLLEEAEKMSQRMKAKAMKLKRRQKAQNSDPIKLLYKRDSEQISSHYSLQDDPNFEAYMERKKRLEEGDEDKAESSVQITDIHHLACNFIDVQSHTDNKNSNTSSTNLFSLSTELKKQNFYVNQIQYVEKRIASSKYDDYMCQYNDHCDEYECDCCVFTHCHCRSICPHQCRCYFDQQLDQNVVDCSTLNLIEVPSDKSETATDMRLNANSLKFLKAHSFFGFARLKYLYLQDNQISYISPGSFEDLKDSLTMLNLASNELTYLNGDEFDGLTLLAVLILNSNPLRDIERVDFISSANLPSIKLVYLYNTILRDENRLSQLSMANSNATVLYKSQITTTTTTTSVATTSTTSTSTTTATTTRINSDTIPTIIQVVMTKALKTSTPYITRTIAAATTTTSASNLPSEVERADNSMSTSTSKPAKHQSNLFESSNEKSESKEYGLISLTNTQLINLNEQVNRTRLMNQFFNRFRLFKWEHFPMVVLVTIVALSCVIVLTVVMVARRIETDSSGSAEMKSTQNNRGMVVDVGGGAFYSTKLGVSDEEDDEDDGASTRLMMYQKYCTCVSRGLKRNSFDSCDDFYDHDQRYDSSTVPVSRSIRNLSLNIYVYYNSLDTEYVSKCLQPILKDCTTLIPDTKFFCKPQSDKYVKLSSDSFYNLAQTNSNTLISSLNNTNSVFLCDSNSSTDSTSQNSSELSKASPKNSDAITANILVISDNFYGYKPISNDSYISLKTKNNTHKDSNSTSESTNSSNSSQYTNLNEKSLLLNGDNYIRNSFKIHMNPAPDDQSAGDYSSEYGCQLTRQNSKVGDSTFSSSKVHSLNQKLMKRLYEIPPGNKSLCSTDNRVNQHAKRNGLFCSNAYNEKLQYKIERYLQHICLKSNKFSNTNFSYVDYTKR